MLVLNSKAYAIIAAMFAQFLSSAPDMALVLWIATVFTLNNLVAFTCWTMAGELTLRKVREARTARLLNWGCALVLASVSLWMALG